MSIRPQALALCLTLLVPSGTTAQESTPKPEKLSAQVKQILGISGDNQEEKGGVASRRRLVRRMATSVLSGAEVAAVQNYINTHTERPPGFPRQHWHAYVNDLYTLLRGQPAHREQMVEFLGATISNKKHDIVIRDYAIQHLVDICPYLKEDGARRTVLRELERASRTMPDATACTAILGWHRILSDSERCPEVRDRRAQNIALRNRVLEKLRQPGLSTAAQATLLQTAASLRLAEALPKAVELCTSEQTPVSLRLASINALGRLGNAGHKPLLQPLAGSHPSELVRNAAALAVKQLQSN